MQYTIHHVTRFQYDRPVSESVTELRMQPRSEGNQLCHNFSVAIEPYATVSSYKDYLSNNIHYFDIPAHHNELLLKVDATVEVLPSPVLVDAWPEVTWDALENELDAVHWDYLHPSRYAKPTSQLQSLSDELQLGRQSDPITTLLKLNRAIFESFEYTPQSTHVESPIDDALKAKKGVCQDFTHIMIALGRKAGIPCRYVSGYLFHEEEEQDRSAEDATHAWVEAWLPHLGWIGFDPTNHLIAAERHIRVAIGRDYADVPPTRGTYKGDAEERLSVGVRVALSHYQADLEDVQLNEMSSAYREEPTPNAALAQQQ